MSNRAYYLKNAERIKAKARADRAANPEKDREKSRRAREKRTQNNKLLRSSVSTSGTYGTRISIMKEDGRGFRLTRERRVSTI